jgi:RNA 3'-terminal phosphate cyclase-like protein
MMAPFAKKPLQLTLRGITTDEHDLSVRTFSYLMLKRAAEILIFARQI